MFSVFGFKCHYIDVNQAKTGRKKFEWLIKFNTEQSHNFLLVIVHRLNRRTFSTILIVRFDGVVTTFD